MWFSQSILPHRATIRMLAQPGQLVTILVQALLLQNRAAGVRQGHQGKLVNDPRSKLVVLGPTLAGMDQAQLRLANRQHQVLPALTRPIHKDCNPQTTLDALPVHLPPVPLFLRLQQPVLVKNAHSGFWKNVLLASRGIAQRISLIRGTAEELRHLPSDLSILIEIFTTND